MKNPLILTLIVCSLFLITNFSSCTDKCSEVTCQNSGTCQDGNCKCKDGFEGSTCESRVSKKFVGTYNGADCTSTCSVRIDQSVYYNSKEITLRYSYAASGVPDLLLNATVEGTAITIQSQSRTDGSITETYYGEGVLSGNELNINLTVVSSSDISDCPFTGTK